MTTETPPIVSLLPDDGRPTWQQVDDLFLQNGRSPPPTSLRDEIVVLWVWAQYGQALAIEGVSAAHAALGPHGLGRLLSAEKTALLFRGGRLL